jgi:hypothetical protein
MKSTPLTAGLLALAIAFGVLLAVGTTTAQAANIETLDAVPSSVSTGAGYEPTPVQRLRAATWRGRTCTTALCKSPRPGGIAEVASFGLAALGGAWISRRRSG